jgi:hypothetical protein
MNVELIVAKHGVVILMVAKQPEDLLWRASSELRQRLEREFGQLHEVTRT